MELDSPKSYKSVFCSFCNQKGVVKRKACTYFREESFSSCMRIASFCKRCVKTLQTTAFCDDHYSITFRPRCDYSHYDGCDPYLYHELYITTCEKCERDFMTCRNHSKDIDLNVCEKCYSVNY